MTDLALDELEQMLTSWRIKAVRILRGKTWNPRNEQKIDGLEFSVQVFIEGLKKACGGGKE
jgi:hypothetical protein